MATKNKSQDTDKIISILSYLIIGIIWYFVDKNVQNSKTKFHVKQGLNLLGFWIIARIICELLFFILPYGLSNIINSVIGVILLVLTVIGIINAINGEQKEIPVIGHYANKYLKF